MALDLRMKSKLKPGDRVRVRAGESTGHCRTPTYLRGKSGVVFRNLGQFRNPEQMAYGKDGKPELDLYQVQFEQGKIWPAYKGGGRDSLLADIYETWLEPIA